MITNIPMTTQDEPELSAPLARRFAPVRTAQHLLLRLCRLSLLKSRAFGH